MDPVVDLTDPELWRDERALLAAFALLRRDQPVSWQREFGDGGSGYWAVVRHADVQTVSRDPHRFSSASGTSIRTLPQPLQEFLGSMLHMDDPRHAKLRRVVSRAFAPRRARGLAAHVTHLADELVGSFCADGGGDAVSAVAAPLPLQVTCALLGIPPTEWELVVAHAETLATSRDTRVMIAAAGELHDCAARLAAAREREPDDDVLTMLVRADVDGECLTPSEIGSFFILLVTAGVLTTRHAIGTGVVALAGHPDQRARWAADLEPVSASAIDELLRWATPVRHFRRTATTDTELGGVAIAAGDKVVMWYTSANFDETIFGEPERFDIARSPNPHLAFGTGPHFCLGAELARHQLAAVFGALLRRAPDYEVVTATPVDSTFVRGYSHVEVRPRRQPST